MEKFISLIIVIAISAIWSWIKESRSKRHDQSHTPPPPPEAADDPWADWNAGFSTITPVRVPPPPVVPVETPVVAMPHTEKKETEKKPVKPRGYEALPVEGERAIPDNIVQSQAHLRTREEDEAIAAHFARWRRSIIDAEILPPKF